MQFYTPEGDDFYPAFDGVRCSETFPAPSLPSFAVADPCPPTQQGPLRVVSQLSDSSDSIRRVGGRDGDGLEYVHIEIVHIVPLDLKRLLLVVDVDR